MEEGVVKIEQGWLPIDLNERSESLGPARSSKIDKELELIKLLEQDDH